MAVTELLSQSTLRFHEELQTLLRIEDELASKSFLFECFDRRNTAGVIFTGHSISPGEPVTFRVIWAEAVHPLPDNMLPKDLVTPINEGMPKLLNSWLARRKSPFRLSRLMRFIPFSGRWILKMGSVKGAPPLKDIVWVPHNHKGHQYCMIIGLFEEVDDVRMAEIVSLSLAYTVKWISDMLRRIQGSDIYGHQPIELTERELACLRWMVAGKTLQDTADIIGTSYANVRYHVEKAKTRHGYATTQQLMVQAALDHNLSPLETAPIAAISPNISVS